MDLLFLAGTIFTAFLLENELFLSLAGQLVNLKSLTSSLLDKLPLLLGGAAVFLLSLYLLGRKYRNHGLVNKLQLFFRQLLSGVRAIGNLKNPMGFWISSVIIWIIYFLTLINLV